MHSIYTVHVVHFAVSGLVPPPRSPTGKSNLIVINREQLKAKKYIHIL